MDIVCYAALAYPDRGTSLQRLQALAPVEGFVACETLEELNSSLLRPLGDILAVVLFPADDADLANILVLREVLVNTRIVLILPAWDPDLVTGAHCLRPRFMTTHEMGLEDVGAVLEKLAEKSNCLIRVH
ncbi:MAG TPA: hypothetical protein DCZ69_04960 [Syntrophobacteraceae bacterium]|nr:hypothetical protein [Syntrophobacteraceae bacterium]